MSKELQIAIQDATYETLRGEREPEEFYEYKMSSEAQAEIAIDRFVWIVNCRAQGMMAVKNTAAVALGKIKSPKKAASSRENGKLGGRPKLAPKEGKGGAKADA